MSNFTNEFIDRFAKMLIDYGLALESQLKGCTEAEVKELETKTHVSLPTLYRNFLKKMGRNAGKFYEGTDMFYDQLFSLRKGLEELLREDKSSFFLPAKSFVFSSHQGYIYHFFHTNEDHFDPPVYGYKEGTLTPKKISNKFSDFLLDSISELR